MYLLYNYITIQITNLTEYYETCLSKSKFHSYIFALTIVFNNLSIKVFFYRYETQPC